MYNKIIIKQMLTIIIFSFACLNNNKNCEIWSSQGECENNFAYMHNNCKKSCNMCNISCEDNAPPLEHNFLKNTLNRAKKYNIKVHSETPLLVEFINFLNDTESDHIISLCDSKFSRSFAGDGITPVRTSEQCWCQNSDCTNDNIIKSVEERISKLVNFSFMNSEYMQILKYEKEQFYKLHHDQNSHHYSPQGPRVFTFFMYLNSVEEGGETEFPKINISVKPTKNNAIIWNSVLGNNIDDIQTYHEAKPVLKGKKYAANIWYHSGNFRMYHSLGCTKHVPNYVPRHGRSDVRHLDGQIAHQGGGHWITKKDEL
jgi:prolyl 4-hydroxylase